MSAKSVDAMNKIIKASDVPSNLSIKVSPSSHINVKKYLIDFSNDTVPHIGKFVVNFICKVIHKM